MNEKKRQPDQNVEIRDTPVNGKISVAGRDSLQVDNFNIKIVARFIGLISLQALKGSIIGAVIGLLLMVISPKIKEFGGFEDYTQPAKHAEFICAVLVALYCNLFCGRLIRRQSKKLFLTVLAFIVTLLILPPIRYVFLSIFFEGQTTNNADTITYSISYAIICVLTGGAIEIIAQLGRKQSKSL